MGPSTGTATAGAQGDLLLLRGLISGGYPLPTLCIAELEDCWLLPPLALSCAAELRTPVVLLTSKEMVMTERSLDLQRLPEIKPLQRSFYSGEGPYVSYAPAENGVPPFLPLGGDDRQVRLTASTHDSRGLLQHASGEALDNTRRLQEKIEHGMPTRYRLDEQEEAETLVVSYGITAGAAREAVDTLRGRGMPVSLLVAQTLLPLPAIYYEIIDRYSRLVLAEENLQGQLGQLLFGARRPANVREVTGIGHMVRPEQIVREVTA